MSSIKNFQRNKILSDNRIDNCKRIGDKMIIQSKRILKIFQIDDENKEKEYQIQPYLPHF